MTAESPPLPSSGAPGNESNEGPPEDPLLPVSAEDLQLALSPQKGSRWWGGPPSSPAPCWGAPLLVAEEEASSSIPDPDVTRVWMKWTDTLTTPTPEGYKNLLNNLSGTHARLQAKSKKVSQLQADLQHVARLLAEERLRSLELASTLETLQSERKPFVETRGRMRRAPLKAQGPPSEQGAPSRERLLKRGQKVSKKPKRPGGASSSGGPTPPPSQPQTARSTKETQQVGAKGDTSDSCSVGSSSSTLKARIEELSSAAKGSEKQQWSEAALRESETLARRRANLYRERLQETVKVAQEERLTLMARAAALEGRAKQAEEALVAVRLKQRDSHRETTRSLQLLSAEIQLAKKKLEASS
ncbi:hypothetical protein Emed_001959 [Eimeria media]